MLLIKKLRQMRLKAFQGREWWMQSAVAAAAAIITNNEEWLFFNFNCLWKASLVEAGSTAFPDRGIFLISCAVVCQCEAQSPCPAEQYSRENVSLGILLPWLLSPALLMCLRGCTTSLWQGHNQSYRGEFLQDSEIKNATCTPSEASILWEENTQSATTCVGHYPRERDGFPSAAVVGLCKGRHLTAQHRAAEQKGSMPWAHCCQIILTTAELVLLLG